MELVIVYFPWLLPLISSYLFNERVVDNCVTNSMSLNCKLKDNIAILQKRKKKSLGAKQIDLRLDHITMK